MRQTKTRRLARGISKQCGVTLIELIIIVAVMALLAALLLPAVQYVGNARDKRPAPVGCDRSG